MKSLALVSALLGMSTTRGLNYIGTKKTGWVTNLQLKINQAKIDNKAERMAKAQAKRDRRLARNRRLAGYEV